MTRALDLKAHAICVEYERRKQAGEPQARIIADLSGKHDIQRPAVWKALRRGGLIRPYARVQPGKRGRPEGGGQPGYTAKRTAQAMSTHERLEDVRARAREAPAEPCGRCGVRADVGCRHRPPEGRAPVAIEHPQAAHDRRSRPAVGQGWGFHSDRFASAIATAKESLRPLAR